MKLKRNYFWKDRKGNELTFKEFMSRWKYGFNNITSIQKLRTQLSGTRISLIGLFLGLVVSIYAWERMWWVAIVLTGAILNTGVQYLGLRQQYKQLKNLETVEEISMEDLFEDERRD